MYLAMRRALQNISTPVYSELGIKSCLPAISSSGLCSPTKRPEHVQTVVAHRTIKNYVKKFRYVLRARRAKEQFKFPERFAQPLPRSAYSDWNYKAELFAFGYRLSEQFDEEKLREALTDQSYVHKEEKKQLELGIDTAAMNIKSNEELCELGRKLSEDFLLTFVRKELPLFPEAGHRALVKHLMSETTCSTVASNLGFKDLILCQEYPPTAKTYSDALYAVIGSLSISSGQERAEKFVIDFIASLLCGKDVNEIWDVPRPWAMMEEIAAQKDLLPVEPRLIRQAGYNTIHAVFVVGIYSRDKILLGTGIGETLDIAQEMAARDVLKGFFNTREPQPPFEFQSKNTPYKLIPHVRNISQSK